jgi:hypothetical protein
MMDGLRFFMVNFRMKVDMVCYRSDALDAVRTMSST